MGVVYRVTNPQGQVQALKLLHSRLDDPHDRLRFEREFRLASSLEHPHLLRVFELGEHGGQPFYTMEWIEGLDLRRHLEQQLRQGNWESYLQCLGGLVPSLLEGLHHLHQHQLVHRDLKPENVLVDVRGHLKLVDFGLARAVRDSQRLTAPGTLVGTPHYMAPEQIEAQPVDGRADLYALGVLIFELLSGRLPHPGEELLAVLAHVLTRDPEPLQPLGPLPQGLNELLMQLLQRAPERRPPDCVAVLRRWQDCFGGGLRLEGRARGLLYPAFQGRKELIESVRRQLGQGGAVLVSGASGSGRSRWLAELSAGLKPRAWKVCCRGCQQVPFGVVVELLEQALAGELPAELESERGVLAPLLPWLGAPADPGPAGKLRLFRALQRALKGADVWLLDDLGRADVMSLEFLHYWLAQGEATTVVATCHPGEAPLSGVVSHTLGELTQEESRQLVGSMLGQPLAESAFLQLWQVAQGNPLMLVELLQALFDEGKLLWQSEQCQLSDSNVRLPNSIRAALQQRLEGLGDEQRELLIWLAIAEVPQDFEELERSFALFPAARLLDELERLMERRVVQRQGRCYHLVPQLGALLLEPLSEAKFKLLHQQMARCLEADERACPERVAHHWLCSQTPEVAADWLVRAAQRQQALFDYQGALEQYELLARLPGHDPETLQRGRRQALIGAGRFAEALELLPGSDPESVVEQARCYWSLGQLRPAHQRLCRLLKEHDGKPPSASWTSMARTTWDYAKVMLGLKRPTATSGPALSQARMLQTRCLFYLRPKGWEQDSLDLMLRQMQVREDTREQAAEREMLVASSFIVGPRRQLERARFHLERAAGWVQELPDSMFRAELLLDVVYFGHLLGLAKAHRWAQVGWECAHKVGAVMALLQLASLQTMEHRLAGRLQEAESWGAELNSLAESTGHRLELAHGKLHAAILSALRFRIPQGRRQLAEALALDIDSGYFLQHYEVAQSYLAVMESDWKEGAARAQPRGPLYGVDQLQALERCHLQVCCRALGCERLNRLAEGFHPVFRVAARRLAAKTSEDYEEALEEARRRRYPLEEGLCLAALARRCGSRALWTECQQALERAALGAQAIQAVRSGTYPLEGFGAGRTLPAGLGKQGPFH